MNWQYTDATNTVAFRLTETGSESCLASVLPEGTEIAAYVPPPVDMQAEITSAMTALFDATAQAKNYDSRITCALRAGYPGPFNAEGIAFASWMDAQNAKAYLMLAEVQAGTHPMPATVEDALALLDPMVWP